MKPHMRWKTVLHGINIVAITLTMLFLFAYCPEVGSR